MLKVAFCSVLLGLVCGTTKPEFTQKMRRVFGPVIYGVISQH